MNVSSKIDRGPWHLRVSVFPFSLQAGPDRRGAVTGVFYSAFSGLVAGEGAASICSCASHLHSHSPTVSALVQNMNVSNCDKAT